ncbi:hypothetical protein WH47_10095 [Habropoda laboriosa]|uniref:Uncharacterized protein n=1 Tax=Habropoda laboriosa TaxID=597456 RepID=A0A0L7R3P9_9HYME|nr:hypothetical protein WH47_10095 [Habropoda laboriosa]
MSFTVTTLSFLSVASRGGHFHSIIFDGSFTPRGWANRSHAFLGIAGLSH